MRFYVCSARGSYPQSRVHPQTAQLVGQAQPITTQYSIVTAMTATTRALALLEALGGFATTQQLLTVMTRQQLDVQVRNGGLTRVWYGVYAATTPDLMGRLTALDRFVGAKPRSTDEVSV
jgi:hypothetical protein